MLSRKKLKLRRKTEKDHEPANPSTAEISEKLEKVQKIVDYGKEYTKIKFKQDIYSVGDNLLIRDFDGFLVGKLTRIITYNGIKKYPYWPTIEVQWYYKKSDLNREKNALKDDEKYDSISEFELFTSNHKDIIFIETIISLCTVLSLEEYERLDTHSSTTFFTRATYDPIHHMINPPFTSWEKACVCGNPLNPDQLYIKCDGCEKWFHPRHCGVNENDAENLKEFYCVKCKKE